MVTHPSVIRYKPKPKDDEPLRQELRQMADLHSRWGFWMMFYRLRALNYSDNHKRVYRIYTEMKLNLRRKYKKRLPLRIQQPLLQPLHHNLTWSMDFVHDGLFQGKPFRAFNVIDDFNREVLTISIDTSLTSLRVIRELDKLIEWRGKPERLRADNGPEFIAQAMEDWSKEHHIELTFIQKGSLIRMDTSKDSTELTAMKSWMYSLLTTLTSHAYSLKHGCGFTTMSDLIVRSVIKRLRNSY
jgi:putative transposase